MTDLIDGVPSWSGMFWTTVGVDGSPVGVMSVHIDDERMHNPPAGWKVRGIFNDDGALCETCVYEPA